MDDTLRNLAFGLFAFVVFHSSLETRARHDARRQVARSFNNTGSIQVNLIPRGPFGLELSDLYRVEVIGRGVVSDRLPFYIYPKPGWKGSIRHLNLDLIDFTLAGLPIRELTADIPNATYDIGHAIYRGHLVLRGSGEGPARVRIGPDGLKAFLFKKFNKTLSDVQVFINPGKIELTGQASLLFRPKAALRAEGRLAVRAGRYLDLIEPTMFLDGRPLSPTFIDAVLHQVNPVLDTYKDLNLGGFFTMEQVLIVKDEVIILGRVGLPTAPPGTALP